jgi:hypothetical protein
MLTSDYLQAIADIEELLDNAKANHSGPGAPWHWDYELRDQLEMLKADRLEKEPKTDGN